MTFTNGKPSSPHNTLNGSILDHTKALEVLRDLYQTADGLDAQSMLDSAKNGGLTYNDFLVLPGYIGMKDSRLQLISSNHGN